MSFSGAYNTIQAKKRIADILAMKLEGKVERCGRDVPSKSFDIDSLGYFGPDGALSALLHLAPCAAGLSSVPHQWPAETAGEYIAVATASTSDAELGALGRTWVRCSRLAFSLLAGPPWLWYEFQIPPRAIQDHLIWSLEVHGNFWVGWWFPFLGMSWLPRRSHSIPSSSDPDNPEAVPIDCHRCTAITNFRMIGWVWTHLPFHTMGGFWLSCCADKVYMLLYQCLAILKFWGSQPFSSVLISTIVIISTFNNKTLYIIQHQLFSRSIDSARARSCIFEALLKCCHRRWDETWKMMKLWIVFFHMVMIIFFINTYYYHIAMFIILFDYHRCIVL